jgi:hypothetical protein
MNVFDNLIDLRHSAQDKNKLELLEIPYKATRRLTTFNRRRVSTMEKHFLLLILIGCVAVATADDIQEDANLDTVRSCYSMTKYVS